MRKLLIILFTVLRLNSSATDYYFATAGDDLNNGLTPLTAWQTLDKFNLMFASRMPGDRFLFNRGDEFTGRMLVTRSGSLVQVMYIGAYGTGANPIISSLVNVSGWTNIGGNIWQSNSAVSTLANCNLVMIGGVNIAMGKTPTSGYYTYQTFVTNTSVTSSSVNSATTNWTGAEVVIRKNNWIIDRCRVTSHIGSTINYVSTSAVNGNTDFGFFLQNDIRTLDAQNEWFFNSATKRLNIYSTGSPTGVQVASFDTLVYTNRFDYITFENIDFIGANKYLFAIPGSRNITITNCSLKYAGKDGVWGYHNFGAGSGTNFTFTNNVVDHINSNGIALATEFINAYIGRNTFNNCGMQSGMGGDGSENVGTMQGVHIKSDNALIEHNRLDGIGYVPIYTLANNDIIQYNHITNFDATKMDGGGYYTWNGITGAPVNTGNKVLYNLILDAPGTTALAGTDEPIPLVHGIYLDANTQNVEVAYNTCANLGYGGLYIYSGSSNNNIHDNTFYNNTFNQMLLINRLNNTLPTTNNTLTNNIFFSRTSTQLTGKFSTVTSEATFLTNLGTLTSNYYARPIADNTTISYIVNSSGSNLTLAQWQSTSSNDAGSQISPVSVATVNDIRFEYNATNSPVAVSLGANYIDVRNIGYPGTITLQPFTSAVLILSAGGNLLPTVDAGSNQTLILPVNTASLAAIASDPDGSIVSYNWSQISGPGVATITDPTNANTDVEDLVAGVYVFQVIVTDNDGGTASDIVQVTVIDLTSPSGDQYFIKRGIIIYKDQ